MMMADYDLILIGKSSFTLDLYREFYGKVNLLFLDNNIFPKDFATEDFPSVTFIPQKRCCDDIYGQLTSPFFRFDLTDLKEVTRLLFVEELREDEEFFSHLEDKVARELNIANILFIENFDASKVDIIKTEFRALLKNLNLLKSLFFSPLPKGKGAFSHFTKGLHLFFSCGEPENPLSLKYFLYSFLSKKGYLIEEDGSHLSKNEEFGYLKGIKYDSLWELYFDDKKITGRIVLSAIPPHIYDILGINHPFPMDYDYIFYLLTPKEPILPPCYMQRELIYTDEKLSILIKNDKEGIRFLVPAPIKEEATPEVLLPVFKELFPHINTLPSFDVKPHTYPYYRQTTKKNLKKRKNIFFPKKIEYPFLGIDGELLYRKTLKELLWRKFL